MTTPITVRLAVGCHRGQGPELFFVRVTLTQQQYAEGEAYKAAWDTVEDLHDADGPYWVTDQNDPARGVTDLCPDWNKTPIVDVSARE